MNTQLYRIKSYQSCFFFSFLAQNCSGFTIEILIIVIKNGFLFSFLFLFLRYATIYFMQRQKSSKRYSSFPNFFLMTGATFIMFFKIVFHSVQLGIPLISSLRSIYNVMLYSIFKMECTVLLFLFEKQLFREHSYVIHLIFKNEINNIFFSNIFLACKQRYA